jgi:hypothetical protein
MSTLSASSAVNHVNDVIRVNDVKTPTPAACGGVSGGEAACGGVQLFVRLRRRLGGRRLRRRVFLTSLTSLTRLTLLTADEVDSIDIVDSGRG